jgi:hypothetical protein
MAIKKTAKKSATKSSKKKDVKKEGEVRTNVRWSYNREFARALGKNGTGKGKARRKDVKAWGFAVLNDQATKLVEEKG